MHVPTPLSRLTLIVAVVTTVVLAWSSWRSNSDAPTALPTAQPVPTRVVAAPRLSVAVDATDLQRGLLHSIIAWDVRPGRQWLRFPRWIQGTHAPCGAIENLAGLVIHSSDGAVLPWARDPRDVFRFAITVPTTCKRINIDLTYLANQPTVNSQPVDVLEVSGSATINWNDCLLYPEGWADERIQIAAELRLPSEWRHACALAEIPGKTGAIAFAHTDLRALIDSPVLCGKILDVHEIAVSGFPNHRLAVTAAKPQHVPARALSQLGAVAAEARELFGGAPFPNYTWLLGVGEDFPHIGLEHLASSLNGISQDKWYSAEGLDPSAAYLLTHEYGHAWCGKHHRPAGMVADDCHTNLDTRLLWIYEGFDQYIGMLLAARSGASSRATWLARMASQIEQVCSNRSRAWRTLEDTAAAGYTLRGQSRNWGELRGSQDYYLEGMLLCFEADGRIRRASNGKRSFDDVLRRFLAPQPGVSVVPYTEADVLACLHAVEPSINWSALIDRLVHRTITETDLTALTTWGMQATVNSTRTNANAAARGYLNDHASIGLVLWQGQIAEVQAGSPADQARLAPGERIITVNDHELNLTNWDHALVAGAGGTALRLRIRSTDDSERDVVVPCPTGPRYLHVAPSPDPADRAILDAIIAPRSAEGRAVRGASW